MQDRVKGGRKQGGQRRRDAETTSRNYLASGKSQKALQKTGKTEKTGCKVTCSVQMTLAVKELMISDDD